MSRIKQIAKKPRDKSLTHGRFTMPMAVTYISYKTYKGDTRLTGGSKDKEETTKTLEILNFLYKDTVGEIQFMYSRIDPSTIAIDVWSTAPMDIVTLKLSFETAMSNSK